LLATYSIYNINNLFSNRLFIGLVAAIAMHIAILFSYLNASSNDKIAANFVGSSISINISSFNKPTNTKKTKSNKKADITKNNIIKENITDKKLSFTKDHVSENLKKDLEQDKLQDNQSDNDILVSTTFSTKGHRQLPQYPKRALKLKQEGVIHLRILLSETGASEKIEFAKKSIYPLLNQAAINAVKKWSFNPMIIDGKPVKSWIEVPIEFKIG